MLAGGSSACRRCLFSSNSDGVDKVGMPDRVRTHIPFNPGKSRRILQQASDVTEKLKKRDQTQEECNFTVMLEYKIDRSFKLETRHFLKSIIHATDLPTD